MLTPFSELLAERPRGAAVGAFTAYNLEGAIATLRAARGADVGVILLIGSKSFAAPDGRLLLDAVVAAAARAPGARACVQLDHCDDLGLIEAALDAGASAVMADGSALPYEDNVAFVTAAVDLARDRGAVEAELGAIRGDEDVALAVAAGALTDPDQAADFTARTRADCLAVSIGNVHGIYREAPRLDIHRLTGIRDRCPVPLSLHGASGLPDSMVAAAIAAGITKINVNTELRAAYLETTFEHTPELLAGSRLADLHAEQIAAVQRVVAAKLNAFDGGADDPPS